MSDLDFPDVLESDMRAIVRLLGRVAALPGSLMAKRCLLLDGLCEFVGADEWIWSLHCPSTNRCLGYLRRNWRLQNDSVPALMEPHLLQDGIPKDLIPQECHILAAIQTVNQTESRIGIVCKGDGNSFSPRRSHLVKLVLEEISWLHWRTENAKASENLSPRLRQVRDLLLLGLGRKEIADFAGISTGTVNGYVREIYSRFGVNSQAALIHLNRLSSIPKP